MFLPGPQVTIPGYTVRMDKYKTSTSRDRIYIADSDSDSKRYLLVRSTDTLKQTYTTLQTEPLLYIGILKPITDDSSCQFLKTDQDVFCDLTFFINELKNTDRELPQEVCLYFLTFFRFAVLLGCSDYPQHYSFSLA